MIVELKGTVKVIFAEEKISDKLSKKEIVITIDEDSQYPQDVIVQAINQKIDAISQYKMGDRALVKANLRGRESKGRYYNQLTIWEINKI
jgi:hypothetical protein